MGKSRRIMDFEFRTETAQNTHFHQDLELIYLLEGQLHVIVGDEDFKLEKGDFLLVNANKKHSYEAAVEEVFLASFRIDYGMLAERLGTSQLLFWCSTAGDKNEGYEELREILNRILDCYFEKEEEGALYLESLYFQALYILTGNFMVKADALKDRMGGQLDSDRVFAIQNYVQANYGGQITLNDLARQLYLSNAYLSKYIKKRFGMGFSEYITNVRLFHALDDLLYTDKKIVSIALDNGFATTGAFNKAFRAYYNMTPSTYRAQVRREQEEAGPDSAAAEQQQVRRRIREYLDGRSQAEVPQQQEGGILEVDAEAASRTRFPWAKVINISDMELLHRADVRSQLLIMKEELQFTHVRIWNVFISSMYNEKAEPGRRYNFNKLDQVLDFLLENKIRPFFELAFKPTQLIYTTDSILVQDENEVIFHSARSYQEALEELAVHLERRYGADEVGCWYFELWHDPRIHIEEPESWYFENFEAGYRILKSITPEVKVGGAGFALGYERHIFKKAAVTWSGRDIRPDFLSVYAYSYVMKEQEGILFVRKSLDSRFLANQLEILRNDMRDAGFEVPEIYVTEWNFTISNRNRLNDSLAGGAFIMRDCIEAEGLVDMLAYWHGTDIYSEYYDASGILSGDSGLITRDGVRKPSFYAFYFMNMLEKRLLGKSRNGIVTAGSGQIYKIACHNSKKLTYRYGVRAENEITYEEQNSLFEDNDAVKLTFVIHHVENGEYLVRTQYVNEQNGSVQEIWREMGFSAHLLQSEIEYVKRNTMPHMEMEQILVEDGTLRIESTLQAHEIRLIEIRHL